MNKTRIYVGGHEHNRLHTDLHYGMTGWISTIPDAPDCVWFMPHGGEQPHVVRPSTLQKPYGV